MGMEWVDDTTCILIFESVSDARTAFRLLQKSIGENTDEDGSITAKPIPMACWPPEERINASLGKSEGLKGVITMRWARHDDMKKKGARNDSQFYKRHGMRAGKSSTAAESSTPREGNGEGSIPAKRRRTDGEIAVVKAQLDEDLDAFLREDSPDEYDPPSPPSKMRSDQMERDGRSLLERTSDIRAHPSVLTSRIIAGLPERGQSRGAADDAASASSRRGRNDNSNGRSRKTQQELDDELDAFLNDRR